MLSLVRQCLDPENEGRALKNVGCISQVTWLRPSGRMVDQEVHNGTGGGGVFLSRKPGPCQEERTLTVTLNSP